MEIHDDFPFSFQLLPPFVPSHEHWTARNCVNTREMESKKREMPTESVFTEENRENRVEEKLKLYPQLSESATEQKIFSRFSSLNSKDNSARTSKRKLQKFNLDSTEPWTEIDTKYNEQSFNWKLLYLFSMSN